MSEVEAVVTGIIANGLGALAASAWDRAGEGRQRSRLRTLAKTAIGQAVEAATHQDAAVRDKKKAKEEIRNIAYHQQLLESLVVSALAGSTSELDERWRLEFRKALTGEARARLDLDRLDSVVDVLALIEDLPGRLRSTIHRDAIGSDSPLHAWWADLLSRAIVERVDRGQSDLEATFGLRVVHDNVSAVRGMVEHALQHATGSAVRDNHSRPSPVMTSRSRRTVTYMPNWWVATTTLTGSLQPHTRTDSDTWLLLGRHGLARARS